MSDERMSFDDAKAFVEKLQEQNVKPSTIRRQMVDKGFSYAEIYELSGEAEKTKTENSRKPKPQTYYGESKDYQYNSYHQQKQQFERGGCLTAYLSVQLIAIALAFFLVCITLTQISSASSGQSGFVMAIVVVVLIVSGLQLACINALWEGKAWGYQGLLGLLFLSAILNLVTGDIAQLGGNIVGAVILLALVNPKSHLLR